MREPKLGQVVRYDGDSYEVRGFVDGRYVVRIRDSKTRVESYRVWTSEDLAQFHQRLDEASDRSARNAEIYERNLAGETKVGLAKEFGLSVSRIAGICAEEHRREKRLQSRSTLTT